MDTLQAIVIVKHQHGLHARPADLFVRKANEFKAEIGVSNLKRPSKKVNAKSILGILSLGVVSGDSIEISADGLDGGDAIQALEALVNSNFGE